MKEDSFMNQHSRDKVCISDPNPGATYHVSRDVFPGIERYFTTPYPISRDLYLVFDSLKTDQITSSLHTPPLPLTGITSGDLVKSHLTSHMIYQSSHSPYGPQWTSLRT